MNNGRSGGKSSALQLLLSRFEEVFLVPIDEKQLPLQTVVLGDEVLQNLDDDNVSPTSLETFSLKNVRNFFDWQPSFVCRVSLRLAPSVRWNSNISFLPSESLRHMMSQNWLLHLCTAMLEMDT